MHQKQPVPKVANSIYCILADFGNNVWAVVFVKNPIFISYTSLSDFLKCPRTYFLKNIYKDKEGLRIQIASPYLSLGSVVHDTIKWYLQMRGQVTKDQLIIKFKNLWPKYQGKRGGFFDDTQEEEFKKRGLKMIDNFLNNIHVLEKTYHFKEFPKLNLLDEVILTGNFDFVGEREDGTLHLIDFKTGTHDEDNALQLYIYAILAEENFGKKVSKASFWYLDRDNEPREIVLDPLESHIKWLKEKAEELKKAVEKNEWVCKNHPDLCMDCSNYQLIVEGKGQFLFTDFRYRKQIYYLNHSV